MTNASTFTSHFVSSPEAWAIHSAKRAMASAAKSTIVPWAKLKTPDALKIRTRPSAISE